VRDLIRRATLLAGVTALAKVLGFVREAAIASKFGAGADVDALQIALLLPNVLYSLFAGAVLGSALLPAYRKVATQAGWDQADRVASVAVNYAAALLVVVVTATIVFADSIVHAAAPGFDAARHARTVMLLQLSAPLMLPFAVSAVLSAALNARLSFVSPVVADMCINAIALAIMWVAGTMLGVSSVIVGYLAGAAVSLAVLAARLRRCGFKYSFCWNYRAIGFREVTALSLPVIVGNVVGQGWAVTERAFASLLPAGAVSLLGYATRLQQLPLAIAGLAIASVALPHLAESAAKKDDEAFAKQVNNAFRLTLFLLIPVCLGAIWFSNDIVALAFRRGAFGVREAQATARLLAILAPSIAAAGVIALFGRAFFAKGDPWPPLQVGIGILAVNGVLDWLLLPRLGVNALAIGYSVSQVLGCIAVVVTFRQRHRSAYAALRIPVRLAEAS
jgi:putative peptidoglycan lipid II flippase